MSAQRPADTGRWAEDLACRYLQAQGLTLIERNYRCPAGEIDLVMEQQGSTVFIEVRYRRAPRFGTGAESVDARKRAKLLATALHYLQRDPVAARAPSRFDVVSMEGARTGPRIRWIPNAFGA
ncbi:MAG: YraN family protein [Chromatiales bacterium 21-64-14]|nr:MAG: YraN family protein [Chromatiales bacterium 21-64-14]HQU14912.1 YraN family protein [Gammaproteobacteria bacterium]